MRRSAGEYLTLHGQTAKTPTAIDHINDDTDGQERPTLPFLHVIFSDDIQSLESTEFMLMLL